MPDYFDMHCHLLFGVDDGPGNIEETLTLLQQEYDDGVRTIFLTPHYRENMFECPADLRVKRFKALKAYAEQRFPGLELILGCEIHVNMDVVQNLKSGKCPTMGNTDFVLLEFPDSSNYRYIVERCHAVMHSGYIPIIAHAERCAEIRKKTDLLQKLVNMGVYIQMNAGSMIGEEGLRQKWFCRKAMKRNLLHFVGSDAHNANRRKPNIGRCIRYIEKTMGREYMEQIMRINPREIIEGSV